MHVRHVMLLDLNCVVCVLCTIVHDRIKIYKQHVGEPGALRGT